MSAVSLHLQYHLDKVQISYPKENLRLIITPTLELECLEGLLNHFQPSDILQALKSGCIWLCRGIACEVSIQITLIDGISFSSLSHEQITEELGVSIRNADFWDQLSLSPSLEISGQENGQTRSHIRIGISHVQPPMDLLKSVTSLSTIAADTKPSDGVPSAALKSLELHLEFRSIRNSTRKRQKKSQLSEEQMLLDDMGFVDDDESQVPEGSESGSASVLPHVTTQSSLSSKGSTLERAYSDSFSCNNGQDKEEDEDLLLCNTNSQMLTPPSSDPRNMQPTLKRRATGMEAAGLLDKVSPLELDLSKALKLTDAGLRSLIGGRQLKLTPGVKLLKPEPKYTLSELGPALWSPGYLKAVSQRSRFLPTLSSALSTSLLKHVQSPSLKKSLLDLANLPMSPFLASKDQISEDRGGLPEPCKHRISRVVQARLWKMTQKSLLDPLAARRLQRMEGPTPRRPGEDAILFSDEPRATELTAFSNLADELAEWMEEEQFEDFLEDEGWAGSEEFCQDYTENPNDFQVHSSEDWWDSSTATAVCSEIRSAHESHQIPPEFWEDLSREEESGGLDGEELLIPDEFWEDLRMEEEGTAAENSNMLI